MTKYFKYSFVYAYHQPCFLSGHYSFIFVSNGVHPFKEGINWTESWYNKKIQASYYNPDNHITSFILPQWSKHGLSTRLSLPQLNPITLNTISTDETTTEPYMEDLKKVEPLCPAGQEGQCHGRVR
eukprot:TRINITY_DN66312_c14_g1_i1.p1 TRINITY_DN66312_c14_g1~~TRINITY_DN66312_c14_g1_i1.p1  ORF type:complete len:126 (+),score=18.94 TRINITY_DN66312_c14_g1_i1:153-530(+)